MAKRKEPEEIGHNRPISATIVQGHVTFLAQQEQKMELIRHAIKDRLNSAKKDDGLSKMALRKAVKNLRMTETQIQAHKEVQEATEYYTDLCRDLPLFSNARGEAA